MKSIDQLQQITQGEHKFEFYRQFSFKEKCLVSNKPYEKQNLESKWDLNPSPRVCNHLQILISFWYANGLQLLLSPSRNLTSLCNYF